VKWFVEGDISDCLGSIDHDILIRIMGKKIDDNRFLRLIKNLLKSGYIDDWKDSSILSGCPQGGILSPLLSNIYMDILDQFVEQQLIPKYSFGTKRAENKEYVQLKNQIRKFQRQENWVKIKVIRN
jgi:retron-type reverse transcriptase